MRGIHQADDGVVHVGVEGLVDDEFGVEAFADVEAGRRGGRRLIGAGIVGDIEEDHAVHFVDRIAAHAHALGLEVFGFRQGWHQLAAAIHAEAPAMIGALDRRLAIGLDLAAGGERHEAVGTDVAQREGLSGLGAGQQDGLAEDDAAEMLARLQRFRRAGVIPAVGQPAFGGDARGFGECAVCHLCSKP